MGGPIGTTAGAPWPLAAWAVAVLAGAALQLQQRELWSAGAYAASALAALPAAVLAWRLPARVRVWTAVLALAVLAFALTGLRAHPRIAERLAPELEGRDVSVRGVVAELPRQLPDGVRFAFDVEAASMAPAAPDGAPQVRLPPRLSLGWYRAADDEVRLDAPFTTVRAGQRWAFTVRLKQPHGTFNPHGFDFELWAFEEGLGALGQVRASERAPARLLDENVAHPVERARQRVRDAILARVSDARTAGVLAALVVGDQAAIERKDWDLFRDTGIAHLVSISGLHVTMFAWLAGGLVGRLWRLSARAMHVLPAPQAARWGGLAAAAAYALLAGWGVPAQRTVWMIAVATLLTTLGLRWPAPLVLLAAAVVVVLADPWALLQPGFWLSFVAVGMLLAAHPEARDAPPATRRAAVSSGVRAALRTQVVTSIGLAPLTLVCFQQVSVVGLLANLVAIPWVTLVVTPLALLGALVPPLWQLAAASMQLLTALLTWLARLPGAVWSAPAAPLWMQAAALAAGVLAVLPLPWVVRGVALLAALPLLLPPVERPPAGAMAVVVADVGQGSAIVVRTREHVLVHDAGPMYSRDSDAGTRVLLPYLRGQGWAPVDLLVLSHRDTDHVGGAAALIAGGAVRALSSSLEPGHPLRDVGVPHGRCEAGQSWRWDGVDFEVLHPRAADYEVPGLKPNALSCVVRVADAAGRSVLLTGDLEADQEARLVAERGAALKSDILLVPHHGSRTSSSTLFLDAVAPRVAPLQAGYRNRYGHPAPDVLARYVARGVSAPASVACGAWQWRSGLDPAEAVCERAAAARYWHHRPVHDGAEIASR